MTMPQYKNLNKSELEMADHYFETGNFNALATLQELSASRSGKNIKVSPHMVLEQHTVKKG